MSSYHFHPSHPHTFLFSFSCFHRLCRLNQPPPPSSLLLPPSGSRSHLGSSARAHLHMDIHGSTIYWGVRLPALRASQPVGIWLLDPDHTLPTACRIPALSLRAHDVSDESVDGNVWIVRDACVLHHAIYIREHLQPIPSARPVQMPCLAVSQILDPIREAVAVGATLILRTGRAQEWRVPMDALGLVYAYAGLATRRWPRPKLSGG